MTAAQALMRTGQEDQAVFSIRGERVMLDSDVAELYGVTTKALNQAVKRNPERFPEDFMFRLSASEKQEVVTSCDRLGPLKFSPYLPFVFTEQGVAMLSYVLRNERAAWINIESVRRLTRMRETALARPAAVPETRPQKKWRGLLEAVLRTLRRFLGFSGEADESETEEKCDFKSRLKLDFFITWGKK